MPFLQRGRRWADEESDTSESDEEFLYCGRSEPAGPRVVFAATPHEAEFLHPLPAGFEHGAAAASASTHERGAAAASATAHERGEPAAQAKWSAKGKHVPKTPFNTRTDVGSMCVYQGNWGGGKARITPT